MEAEISEQFEQLGNVPDAKVLEKCVELCFTYNIEDAEEFVEQWMAFSVTNLNGAEPTVPYLAEMERKEFIPKRDKQLTHAANKKKNKYSYSNTSDLADSNPLSIYGIDSRSTIGTSADGMDIADDDIVDAYMGNTPKAKTKISRTPAQQRSELLAPGIGSPIFGTPRSRATPGSGKTVMTFGNPALISSEKWSSDVNQKVVLKHLLLYNGEPLSLAKDKYMFDNLLDKADTAGDRLFEVGQALCKKVFGSDTESYELYNVDIHSNDSIKTIGTICCDFDGKLDSTSTVLIGSDEMRCRTVRLNFSKTKSFSVFPGQIVMVTGMNPKGDAFLVEEVIGDRELSSPSLPELDNRLSMVVAAGPFTQKDDLLYEPLEDLLLYCKDNRPDVLILIGPFMDANHSMIHNLVTDSFEMFFEKLVARIVESVGGETLILLVASQNDVNADPVYPTFPMSTKKSYPNVCHLPDPTIVSLNGVSVGITSTDILEHILEYELVFKAPEVVKRLVGYLFNQGSFYPLHPSPPEKVCFDSGLAVNFAKIEQIPNIIILPSDQKCFIRVINGCLAINPGRICAESGGTFVRLIVTPPANKDEKNLFNFVACQVRKI